jgi:hemoglobin
MGSTAPQQLSTLPAHTILSALTALILSTSMLAAHGQTLAPPVATPAPLYAALGQQDGIRRLADDFVQRLSTDPRTAPFFKESNLKRVREKIAEQLCQVTGGGCTYTGDSMAEVHKGQGIQMADFNAVVEILQDAMDQQGIAFRDQNKLLAKLAPMHRDMIETPKKPMP